MHEALHGEAEDRLLAANGVTAGHRTSRFANDVGGCRQDGGDRLDRQALGKGRDVQRHHHPAAHGEHVAAGVGRGDGAEVGGVVDERGEEVGRGHDGEVVADPVHGGVVERRQPDEQGRDRPGSPARWTSLESGAAPHFAAQPPQAVHSVSRRSARSVMVASVRAGAASLEAAPGAAVAERPACAAA